MTVQKICQTLFSLPCSHSNQKGRYKALGYTSKQIVSFVTFKFIYTSDALTFKISEVAGTPGEAPEARAEDTHPQGLKHEGGGGASSLG